MRPEIKTRLDDYLYDLWPAGSLNLFDAIGDLIEAITGNYPAYYWPSTEQPPNAEDLMYMYITHSGKKYVNQSVIEYVDRHGDLLPFQKLDLIAKLIVPGNYDNWGRRWAVLQKEYNPLNNYDMIETGETSGESSSTETGSGSRTEDGTSERTANTTSIGSRTHQHTGSGTDSESGTEEKDITAKTNATAVSDTDNYINAFNTGGVADTTGAKSGSSSSGANTGTESGSHSNTITRSATDEDTDTDTNSQSSSDNGSDSRSSTESRSETVAGVTAGSHTLTRSGNIGVTTSQQMLQAELDLRVYDFYESIFADVDKILCERVYSLE